MTSPLNALHMKASESLRSSENKMEEKNTNIIFPVVLKVPLKKQSLTGKDSVRFLRKFARQAVITSAQKTGIDLPTLEKDSDGVPVPSNGVFWSLSHKPEYVAGVIATHPVGIDVERIRPVQSSLADKVIDSNERQLAGMISDALFYRYWTAKEAVLKAVGVGLKGLAQCKIDRIIDETTLMISFQQTLWTIEHVYFDKHVASVVRRGKDIQWIIPEQTGIVPQKR